MFHYDAKNAAAYAGLSIEGTTYQPGFDEIGRHLQGLAGKAALDFGCGAGRSTRFLRSLGARRVYGVDHNAEMIRQALTKPEEGIMYLLITEVLPLDEASMDAAISVFAFLETEALAKMLIATKEIYRVLKPNGLFILNTGNPEALRKGGDYINFSYPGNENLQSGEKTVCRMKSAPPFTIDDVYWSEKDYEHVLQEAGFSVQSKSFPLVEGEGWCDETVQSPHLIYRCVKPPTRQG